MRASCDFRQRTREGPIVKLEMTQQEFLEWVEFIELHLPYNDLAVKEWRGEYDRLFPQDDEEP